jgi:hypothetical protein
MAAQAMIAGPARVAMKIEEFRRKIAGESPEKNAELSSEY